MKKGFIALIVFCLVILAGVTGQKYFASQRIRVREAAATAVLKGPFAQFIKTWDLARVPLLFVDGARIKQIALGLVEIKQTLGNCEMQNIGACLAADRMPEKDKFLSKYGHSVSCTFLLSCEKVKVVTGDIVFFPLGNDVKIYKFDLTTPDEETPAAAETAGAAGGADVGADGAAAVAGEGAADVADSGAAVGATGEVEAAIAFIPATAAGGASAEVEVAEEAAGVAPTAAH